ncbi:hypothetical protein QQS21_009867 [Conoideocrella luteorostrata]|uniref:Uncharacterized protein n=1 Tax=Conoideocrella luteorostrata TaxID=1105319 RepID=A0AAJ0CGG1_9HYPO|nr:hypothetical protein QQS21_009867 [Conoideocrella luteorostrata]
MDNGSGKGKERAHGSTHQSTAGFAASFNAGQKNANAAPAGRHLDKNDPRDSILYPLLPRKMRRDYEKKLKKKAEASGSQEEPSDKKSGSGSGSGSKGQKGSSSK